MKDLRRVQLLLFFAFIAASQKLFDPAYNGYLMAFGAATVLTLIYAERPSWGWVYMNYARAAIIVWLLLTVYITLNHHPTLRDLFRDFGAVLAFAIGRVLLPKWQGPMPHLRLMNGLSDAGVALSLATLAGAGLAYMAGASAYHWRGDYVLMAHGWLPYCLVVNLALAQLHKDQSSKPLRRAALCVLGTFASLSRTDLLLLAVFAATMLLLHGRTLLGNRRQRRVLFASIAITALLMPLFSTLDVVQQRVEAGVDEDDASLGWRLIENIALLDQIESEGMQAAILGFGWGARTPLPMGVEDFDGNDSIPLLHNSFLTIVLKFGTVGLLLLLVYLVKLFKEWARRTHTRETAPFAFAGGWIVVFCLGKAVTLQGLTEWSHLIFFGLACYLLAPASYIISLVRTPVALTRGLR